MNSFRKSFFPVVLLGISHGIPFASAAEKAPGDTLELPSVVTSAGKTSTRFHDSPVAASVIGQKEMQRHGAVRLGDVLNEETGLVVTTNQFGSGVQMQGLDPAYTLILIDGEPAVGRTGGTLDLDRLMVGGLEQVEILKGPSSSLYGSEALGGVINLVTRRPSEPFSGSFQSRYGSSNALDVSGTVETKRGAAGLSLFANRTSSDGFDLDPADRGQTAPRFQNYTLQPKAVYEWQNKTRLTVAPRMFWEKQSDDADYVIGNSSVAAVSRSEVKDWGVSTTLEREFNPKLSWTLKGYLTGYQNRTSLNAESDDSSFSTTVFDQQYSKAETFLKKDWGGNSLIAGGGGIFESVQADYVDGGAHDAASGFGFLQDDLKLTSLLLVQTSLRLDAHQDYATHLSPKVAGLFRPLPWLGLRASVGNGFKAPTSQQLYLNFTNPQVGYSVFGATGIEAGLQRLRDQGQIQSDLQTSGAYGSLRPENSWAFSAGLELSPAKNLSAKANVFRNNVRDLIESAPVAIKTNQQSVFTYFNLDRVHTEGVESEASFKVLRWLTLSAGYQLLIAEDENIIARIEADSIYKIGANGRPRPVQLVEYGGLFNRSRHSGNVKLDVQTGSPGFSASLRGIYRGRYGYGDVNGNGILDQNSEYAPGYFLWNASVSQKFSRFVVMQFGMDNILEESAPSPTPTLPGRRIYASLGLQYF